MKEHHIAWLNAHPERDEFWLQSALENGFDVHHLDGDHGNNDPENLVLIEHTDHMRLHGIQESALFRGGQSWTDPEERRSKSQRAYEIKAADPRSVSWREVADQLGLRDQGYAINYAKYWAQAHGLKWPLPAKRSHMAAVREAAQ